MAPRLLSPAFVTAAINPRIGQQTSSAETAGSVYDSDLRTTSNLVADQAVDEIINPLSGADRADLIRTKLVAPTPEPDAPRVGAE